MAIKSPPGLAQAAGLNDFRPQLGGQPSELALLAAILRQNSTIFRNCWKWRPGRASYFWFAHVEWITGYDPVRKWIRA